MKIRELSSLWTPFYKVLPLIFIFYFGSSVFSMFFYPNTWHCYKEFKKTVCGQIKQDDVPFTSLSNPLSEDEKQAAFYYTRDTTLLLFVFFLSLTLYPAWVLKRVQVFENQLIISDYIRTVKVPCERIYKIQVNSFPKGSMIIFFKEPNIFGSEIMLAIKQSLFSYDTENTTKDLENILQINNNDKTVSL